MKKKIAITGGIGSGKSTVCKCLSEMGYSVFSCDKIYNELLFEPSYISEIEKAFPSVVVHNQIDKTRLASIIFSSDTAREKLNSIAHPLIMERLHNLMDSVTEDTVFAEVPLLFERGYEQNFDKIIVVMRNLEQRIQATSARDNITASQAMAKIQAQYDYAKDEKQLLKNVNVHILDNNGNLSSLKNQLLNILENINA